MRRSILAAAVISSALVAPSFADEIIFKNGDHITGKIETMEGGKMLITSKVAGKITVDMKDVKTFSSDGPIAIRLKDNSTVNQKVDAGADGQVALAPGGKLAGNLSLGDMGYVNYKEDWNGNITAAGVYARGNTESETLNLGIHMTRRTINDRITADAGYLFGRQRFTTPTGTKVSETQNDWFVGAQYNYYFNDIDKKLYGYVNGKVERDVIAGISLRVTPGGGVGYDWFDKPDIHFHTEGGVSWLYRDYSHVPAGTPSTEETVALRLAYHFDYKFSDKVLFFHNFEYFPGLDSINDYYFDTDAGIRATLTEKMFAEFKIQEQYDQRPAPGKGKNDTQFILGVGWNF